jgi:hypothetical protein
MTYPHLRKGRHHGCEGSTLAGYIFGGNDREQQIAMSTWTAT